MKTAYLLLIAISLFALQTPVQSPVDTFHIGQSILIEEGSTQITPDNPLIINITFTEDTGYFGDWNSESSNVTFSIIRTYELDELLDGTLDSYMYTIENQTANWEFISFSDQEVVLVFETLFNTNLSYLIFEDVCPPYVQIVDNVRAIFPPVFTIEIRIFGRFSPRAWIQFPNYNNEVYCSGNCTRTWRAYDSVSGGIIPIPDGVYNITIRYTDSLYRSNSSLFQIVKTTDAASSLFIGILVTISFLAIVIEFARRRSFGL